MNRQGPEQSQPAAEPIISAPVGRRSVLKGMGAGAVAVGAGGLLAACSSGIKGSGAAVQQRHDHHRLRHPADRPAGRLRLRRQVRAQPDPAAPARTRTGFKVGGKTYKVNIVVQDSQSDPNRASAGGPGS